MKITTTWLNNRQEPRNRPKERYDVTIDGRDGLMVRVYPSGSSTFRFRYTGHDGARRVMVLGEYGGKGDGLTLADAYVIHAAAQRELELGLEVGIHVSSSTAHRQASRQGRSGSPVILQTCPSSSHVGTKP